MESKNGDVNLSIQFINKMKIPSYTFYESMIDDVHRLGRPKGNTGKQRPVIIYNYIYFLSEKKENIRKHKVHII